jgi:phytoene dehydrogenase-like protein
VPAGFNSQGLPMGLQLIGKPRGDRAVLQLAQAYEEVAQDMLSRGPALRERFERKLKDDAAFASDPQARLEYFYRLHTAWDERFGLYPVMRTEATSL